MKKYIEIGKINFLNNINYFGEFFFKSLFILLILFIFANLWQVIYSGKPMIEGFTLAMMMWYLLMTESIFTSASSIVRDINQEVQSGEIAYRLNKPYNYMLYHFTRSISYRIISFSVTFILGAILIYLLVGGFNFNFNSLPFVIITILLAIILDIFMLMSIALLAFWFEDNNSFRWVYDKIVFTIGGMLIPLELFPVWISKTSMYLPFSYIAYHPAKVFIDFSFTRFIYVAGIQLVYIVLFILICSIIYKAGARRININGG